MKKSFTIFVVLLLAVSIANVDQPGAVTLTQLTTNPGTDADPDWCPLGDTVAYVVGHPDMPYEIWKLPTDGTEPIKLTESSYHGDIDPDWSPDGQLIVFRRCTLAFCGLFTMKPDGDSIEQISDGGGGPRWSPDGSCIAYQGSGDLFVIPDTGGTPIRLTFTQEPEGRPTWSPDGSKIAYGLYYGANVYDIFWMPSTGGDQTKLTTEGTYNNMPAWSPNGEYIAFASNRGGNIDIWVMDYRGDTYGSWQITNCSQEASWPTWSPDGLKIAFHSDSSGNRDIWMASNLGLPGTGPGQIAGAVKDASTTESIIDAIIRTHSMPYGGDQSDDEGSYSFPVPPGTYQIEVSASGYQTETRQVEVEPEQAQVEDFNLAPIEVGTVALISPKKVLPLAHDRYGVMDEEPDGKITSGDHVHLKPVFRTTGLVNNLHIRFEGGMAWGEYPSIKFSIEPRGPYDYVLDFYPGDFGPGETEIQLSVWMYISNVDYESRHSTISGLRPKFTIQWYDGGGWHSERIIVNLGIVDFSSAPSGEPEFLSSDCLTNPENTRIRAYAQYSVGNPFSDVDPLYDPDWEYGALFNMNYRMPREFKWDGQKVSQGRLQDLTLLQRRCKDSSTPACQGFGVCFNFADLAASLLRSIGLPARRVWGSFPFICVNKPYPTDCVDLLNCFLFPLDYTLLPGPGHAWNEYFFDGEWRYFDGAVGEYEPIVSKCDEPRILITGPVPYLPCKPPSLVWAETDPLAHGDVSWASLCNPSCYDNINCSKCLSLIAHQEDKLQCGLWVTGNYNCEVNSKEYPLSLAVNDSLSLKIVAPKYVEENQAFEIQAIIGNHSPASMESIFVSFLIRVDAADSIGIFSCSNPLVLIESLAPFSYDTAGFDLEALQSGSAMPLIIEAFKDNVSLSATSLISINETGTLPNLVLSAVVSDELTIGEAYWASATVLDTSFEQMDDAILWTEIASIGGSYIDSTVMSYSGIDSIYTGTILLPDTAPIDTYLTKITASKTGFDTNTVRAYFHVRPIVVVSSSSDQSVYSPNDTLFLSATVTERDSLVTEAKVTAKLDVSGDSVFVPLFFDSTYMEYKSEIVVSDFASHFTTLTIPSGFWDIYVNAIYMGGLGTDSVSINVQVPDLSISSCDLSFDILNPTEGDLITIFVKIHNSGNFVSDTSQMSFYYDFIDDNYQIGPTCPIPPISPSDSITISVMWSTLGYGGEGTIYAVIDPNSSTVQSSRENDVASKSISISQTYYRGDVNQDQNTDIVDAVYMINYLFKSGPEPQPFIWIGDVNCDGEVTIADVVYLINYLFKSGPEPC